MYGNRMKYEVARLIKFNVLKHKDKILNYVILVNGYDEYVVVDLKDKRNYLRKGYGVVGYFDYLPSVTSLELSDIIKEVFEYV